MNVTYNKTGTLRAQMGGHPPIVLSIAENQQACVTLHEEKANCISVGGGSRDKDIHASWCYSIDEKMGQTYVWHEKANTLASRDYKQPQAVLVKHEKT